MVYTPMSGSPTINVIAYTKFRGSTKLKFNPFKRVLCWRVKGITQDIKTNLYNISVWYLQPRNKKIFNRNDNWIMIQ